MASIAILLASATVFILGRALIGGNSSGPAMSEMRDHDGLSALPTSGMNDGDFNSEPQGYSPNAANPNSEYGSAFDEDSEWYEDQ